MNNTPPFTNEAEFAAYLKENYGENYNCWDEVYGDFYGVVLWVEGEHEYHRLDSFGAYFFGYRGPFNAEYWGSNTVPDVCGGTLVFYNTDSTKSGHDDIGWFIADNLWDFFRDGSPVRKTNRSGPNTQGTRAIEGLGDRTFYIAFEG